MAKKHDQNDSPEEAKETGPKLADNEIILFGKPKLLGKLKGRTARLKMPQVLNFAAKVLAGLSGSSIGSSFFDGKIDEADLSLGEIAKLIAMLTRILGEQWETFDKELLPFLLQCDEEEEARLEDEGGLVEVYVALFRAVKWLFKGGFTDAQQVAFRKLFAESERRAVPGKNDQEEQPQD